MAQRPLVTLTTDFGLNDHFVGTVKGVILSIAPEAEIVDVCHAVRSFDILDGALAIASAYSYFPPGTVHMVVVDPGVGSSRRPIVATTEQHYFVAPDNGVLSLIYAREERLRVHHVTSEHYFLSPVSQTFHARDIFAPVAAYLARGVPAGKLGEQISDFVRFQMPQPKQINPGILRGVVLKVDHFGNLITNLTPQDAPALFQPAAVVKILVGGKAVSEIHTSYSEGAPGEVFGILGSMGYLEIAANRGSAAQQLAAVKGTDVDVITEAAAGA